MAPERDPLADGVRRLAGWASRRKLALLLATACASLALFGAMYQVSYSYRSEGFLRADRTLAEYNTHRAAIEDTANLRRYLHAAGLEETPNGQYLLQEFGAAMLRKHVRAVMQYSKDDLKLLADDQRRGEAKLLGFNITFGATTPEDATARVRLVGEFLRDSLLKQELLERIRLQAGEARAMGRELELQRIAKRVELDKANVRLAALQTVASKYPAASRFESQQLLSSDGGAARFLSPVMQLVGAESQIADLKIDVATLERKIALNKLRLDFYLKAEPLTRQEGSGGQLFEAFQRLKAASFPDSASDGERVSELSQVSQEVQLLISKLSTKNVVDPGFASGPSLPGRRSGPSIALLAILALLGGSALAAAAIAGAEGASRALSRLWTRGTRASLHP